MLSVFILAILIIALLAFLWYGWKNHKFGEHYGIYLIHIFKREQYQNLMPIVAGDVIIILTFVMAGIIGYKQKS